MSDTVDSILAQAQGLLKSMMDTAAADSQRVDLGAAVDLIGSARLELAVKPSNEMRADPRHAEQIFSVVMFGDVTVSCIIEDISAGGARLNFGTQAMPGVGNSISIRLPWFPVAVAGEVRETQGPSAHVQFRNMPPDLQIELEKAVEARFYVGQST